jgi:hypothetical protein
VAAPHNPLGAKSDKIWRDAIMRAVRRRDSGEDPQALEKLADKLVAKGLEGDIPALKEIGDRLDGKPTQELTGKDGGPLITGIAVEFIEPKGTVSE